VTSRGSFRRRPAPTPCTYPATSKNESTEKSCFLTLGAPDTMSQAMSATELRGETQAPAPSYAAHRERVLAAGFPVAVAVVVGLTLLYVVVDLPKAPTAGQFVTYGLELLVPLAGWLVARTVLHRHVEAAALATDLCFTAVLAGRLLLPTTTTSGTALFLSLKMLATSVLWPWHPQRQYVSAFCTMMVYLIVVAVSDRTVVETHQLVGPLIAAVLSCVGATIADRTRRDLWRRSVALADSEQRLRALLDSERTLVAIARELSVLTDLRSALDRVNGLTAAALSAEFSITYLVDDARREVAAAATSVSIPALRQQILAVRSGFDWPLVAELLAGRTIVINDPSHQPWFPPGELELQGVRHVALTPIAVNGRTLGVLTVTRTTTCCPFGDREIALLKAIAAQSGIAIENARLFDGLAKSEAGYRDLFERATDLVVVIEESGPLRFANQAALDFVGVDAERLHELSWHDFVAEGSRRRLERRLALARRPSVGVERGLEIEVVRPGAPPATLELRARVISQKGQPRAYQCIARDVTERRRHERELQQLLRQLREANRLQAEFVANMSHELRTPLNVIIGYSDLLADEIALPPGSDAQLFLTRISAAGRALHRLVESVLEYARLDRGRYTLITTRFPATQLLQELRELADDVRGSNELTLHIQEHADILFATDYDRLHSILSNLLLNAIKFTSAGSVELAVRRVGECAEFTVRDTGIGIGADELERVFEPFRQVDGSPTRSYGGVGLGLAIVRRNVELLRGTVTVDSQIGIGTTFRVLVPVDVEAEADLVRTPTAA
jgi:PAS domain S-box-containing protein